MNRRAWLLLFLGCIAANGAAAQDVPTLRYNPPPNFYRSGSWPEARGIETTVFHFSA